jgi:hypothetical protein
VAKSAKIIQKENAVQVFIDGQKIEGVISFELSKNDESLTVLNLGIAIINEAQIEI